LDAAVSYEGIVISVSDGEHVVSLPEFSIAVMRGARRSVTVSWMPPTQNTDGSALTNLAGYHLYYGTSSTDLDRRVEIANPGIVVYIVEDLPVGLWHFAMSAYSTAQAESDRSAIVSRAVE